MCVPTRRSASRFETADLPLPPFFLRAHSPKTSPADHARCWQYILGKKGQLAKVWLAAHVDKKLSKQQALQADVAAHARTIISQEVLQKGKAVPLALRISGHLLLGVARIYSRQVRYLLTDATDVLAKIRKAFAAGTSTAQAARAADVDLPESQLQGKASAITLQPDFSLHDVQVDFGDYLDVEAPLAQQHTAQPQDITLLLSTPPSSQQEDAQRHALDSLASLPEFDRHSIEVARGEEVDDFAPQPMDLGGAADEPLQPVQLAFEADGDFFGDAAPLEGAAAGGGAFAMTPPRLSLAVAAAAALRDDDAGARRKRKVVSVNVDAETQLVKAAMVKRVQGGEHAVKDLYRKPAWDAPRLSAPSQALAPELSALLAMAEEGDAERAEDEPSVQVLFGSSDAGAAAAAVGAGGVGGASAQEPAVAFFQDSFSAGGGGGDYDDDGPGPMAIDNDPEAHAAPLGEAQAQGQSQEQQAEGTIASKTAQKFLNFLDHNFKQSSELSFNALTEDKERIVVVRCFFALLDLKSRGLVDLRQQTAYEDVVITQVN